MTQPSKALVALILISFHLKSFINQQPIHPLNSQNQKHLHYPILHSSPNKPWKLRRFFLLPPPSPSLPFGSSASTSPPQGYVLGYCKSEDMSNAVSRKNLSFCTKATLRGNVQATGVPTSVPVRVAHELYQAGHRYLDVRTPEEFSAGHVPGAINIPYMHKLGSGLAKNPSFLAEVSEHFGKYDELIVGCQLGKRSLMAGFTGAGGYGAWTQSGLPKE